MRRKLKYVRRFATGTHAHHVFYMTHIQEFAEFFYISYSDEVESLFSYKLSRKSDKPCMTLYFAMGKEKKTLRRK